MSAAGEIVVVGGGAAGMMAAVAAAERGARVLLLERNQKLGRKLYITGKGRCNLTNRCTVQEALAAVPRNGRFLYGAMSRTAPADVEAFFESLGVPLKVERGSRVFPRSDRAADVIDALLMRLRKLKVSIVQDRATELILHKNTVTAVRGEHGQYDCKAVILATGGLSYPATGSTGDGYELARAAGHTVTPLKPSLVPLESDDPACKQMQGLSLRNVALRVKNGKGKAVFQEQGELLFTHFGLSGPLVLSASAHMDFEKDSYLCVIDLKPALDEETLDARLLREFSDNANRDFQNALAALTPRLMIPVLAQRCGVPRDKKCRDLTRAERRRLLEQLKGFTVAVRGTRPVAEAIVTSGGVKTGEVDPKTMASKLVSGLFFAGELLDVDGYTGGFNLQIAWATGRAAGESAAEFLQGGSGKMSNKSVAIDGPAGAGKSTLARALAKELGYLYVDTGAIYRTVALHVHRAGADVSDPAQVLGLLAGLDIRMDYDPDGVQRMFLGGEDVSSAIRAHEVSDLASKVSAIPAVRDFLLDFQRRQAREHSVVMDGRDIGTVVLPDADVKIFLTADPAERAKRRLLELEQRGEQASFDEILRDICKRDEQDRTRAIAPLRQARDAVLLDTTRLDLAQSLRELKRIVKERV